VWRSELPRKSPSSEGREPFQPATSELLERRAALNEEKKEIDALFRPMRDRIFLYKDEECTQSDAGFCPLTLASASMATGSISDKPG
jgi:hypothetical protein